MPYWLAKEMEIKKNVRIIMVGKINHLAKDVIRGKAWGKLMSKIGVIGDKG